MTKCSLQDGSVRSEAVRMTKCGLPLDQGSKPYAPWVGLTYFEQARCYAAAQAAGGGYPSEGGGAGAGAHAGGGARGTRQGAGRAAGAMPRARAAARAAAGAPLDQ
eukprot:2234228-Pyramimonas_sp.AAC.2